MTICGVTCASTIWMITRLSSVDLRPGNCKVDLQTSSCMMSSLIDRKDPIENLKLCVTQGKGSFHLIQVNRKLLIWCQTINNNHTVFIAASNFDNQNELSSKLVMLLLFWGFLMTTRYQYSMIFYRQPLYSSISFLINLKMSIAPVPTWANNVKYI